jgi:carboxylate-amine ligase
VSALESVGAGARSADSDLPFAPSERSTVGIEWELALVDADSRELRQAAPAIVAELAAQGPHPHIHQEFMQNTVELVSGVSHTVGQAGLDLAASVARLRPITDSMRVDLIGAGTHPFSPWYAQKITEKQRYWDVVERAQMTARQVMIFGVHTHVGVETRAKVMPLLNAMLVYQPHLLALSASSPYWRNISTGYASMRSIIFQQLPTSGIPYQFENWAQLEHYVSDLRRTDTVGAFDEIRWDIRPSLQYGTIETRVCDSVSNITELLAINALTHCLVEYLSTLIDDGAPLPKLSPWFVAENKWRAARYGLDAEVILADGGAQMPIRESIGQLVEKLLPTAKRLGCAAELAFVPEIIRLGASYERQRRVHATALAAGATVPEAFEAVVAHLAAEMKADRPLPA